jgi:hypothetical protein
MYFIHKKTTVNAMLLHLDKISTADKQKHIMESFRIGKESLTSITNPNSRLPIHFVFPIISPSKLTNHYFTSGLSVDSIIGDVLGVNSVDDFPSYPKVVIDNMFSGLAKNCLKENIIEKKYPHNSIFKTFGSKATLHTSASPYYGSAVPINSTYEQTLDFVDSLKERQRLYSVFSTKCLLDYDERKGQILRNAIGLGSRNRTNEEIITEESRIMELLSNKSNKSNKESNLNALLTVDYMVSLSELDKIGTVLCKLYREQLRGNPEITGEDISFIQSYSHTFLETWDPSSFSTNVANRLHVDEATKKNLKDSINLKSHCAYDVFLQQANDFELTSEHFMDKNEGVTNLNNTFVPITFLLYMEVNPNLFNKPEEIIKYSFNLTSAPCVQGTVSNTDRRYIVDKYDSESFTTTINTTILPLDLTDLMLKSKLRDLKDKQVLMVLPNTELLATQYGLIYNPEFKNDFIFYSEEESEKIQKQLPIYMTLRFDRRIHVLHFPHIIRDFPLSIFDKGPTIGRSMNSICKELLFEYLDIPIDYKTPIQKSLAKITELEKTRTLLDTVNINVLPASLFNYLRAWLICLYISKKALTNTDVPKKVSEEIVQWKQRLDFQYEARGGWRNDPGSNHGDFTRAMKHLSIVFPGLVEIVYEMLHTMTEEELLVKLKTKILPEVKSTSNTLIKGIHLLYKDKDVLNSWYNITSPNDRGSLRNTEARESVFVKIEKMLYKRYHASLSGLVGKANETSNYDILLTHMLTTIKVCNYFRMLKRVFLVFLNTDEPRSYISKVYKDIINGSSLYNSHSSAEFIQLIVRNHIKNNPKEVPPMPSISSIENLIPYFDNLFLDVDTVTF